MLRERRVRVSSLILSALSISFVLGRGRQHKVLTNRLLARLSFEGEGTPTSFSGKEDGLSKKTS